MPKFRKKPVTVEAVQYHDWMRKYGYLPAGVSICPWRDPYNDDLPTIHTMEGDHIVSDGDWVITGVKGERYPCKPEIFAATYEPAVDGITLAVPPHAGIFDLLPHAPFFTIITPTLQRDSLVATCQSIDCQTFEDWHHIVIVDQEDFKWCLLDPLCEHRRGFAKCDHPHQNGGNTCRHNAWSLARGRYIIYLDDDNFLADATSLQRIHDALEAADFPQVAFFPILRMGARFFPEGKPAMCHVDTSNVVIERSIAQWPDIDAYCSDGVLIEDLVAKFPYRMFGDVSPIVVMPKISYGIRESE